MKGGKSLFYLGIFLIALAFTLRENRLRREAEQLHFELDGPAGPEVDGE